MHTETFTHTKRLAVVEPGLLHQTPSGTRVPPPRARSPVRQNYLRERAGRVIGARRAFGQVALLRLNVSVSAVPIERTARRTQTPDEGWPSQNVIVRFPS